MDATPTVQLNNTVYKKITEESPEDLIVEIGGSAPKIGPAEILPLILTQLLEPILLMPLLNLMLLLLPTMKKSSNITVTVKD